MAVDRTPADHSVMRGLNRSLVLDVLRREGPMSRADMAKRTTLTKPTVAAIVDGLLQEELAVDLGEGESGATGGRRPVLVEFNWRSQFFLGVQVGETDTEVALTDAAGNEIAVRSHPTSRDPQKVLTRVIKDVGELMRSADAPPDRLRAVGVSIPGLVDEASGLCLLAPNIGWKNVPVADIVSRGLKVPALVRNHAQAAALAEFNEGAGRGSHILVYLYAQTGVGAGIIIDGEPFSGATGVAGEIGHCRVAGANAKCTCGKTGCLETVASLRAVVADALGARRRGGQHEFKAVVDAAAGGNRAARNALTRAARELGSAAATLVNMFGPNVLVAGGSIIEDGGVFDEFRTALAADTLAPVMKRLELRTPELGLRGGLRGAILVAQRRAAHAERLLLAPQPAFEFSN
ncbi:MAG: hypothetical protein QOK28_2648 [Actinomycetota bacterium]|jgi:predicted NBD/HSP70 family sugar kinase